MDSMRSSIRYEPLDRYTAFSKIARISLFCFSFLLSTILLLYVSSYCFGEAAEFSKTLDGSYSHGKYYLVNDKTEDLNNEIESDYKLKESTKETCSIIPASAKFDCYPEDGGNEELCKSRGCCWQQTNYTSNFPPLNVPWCYYPKSYGGYEYLNLTYSKNGVVAFLQRTFPSPYPSDIKLLRLEAQYLSSNILHLKIVDPVNHRFEPIYPEVPIGFSDSFEENSYKVTIDKTKTLFQILRSNDDIVFDAFDKGAFIFADQFLQISGSFQGKIYGLGEHRADLLLPTNWTRFTMFNHDVVPLDNMNLYGSHPFYMVLEPSGNAHGVFFRNSNAMDVLLQPLPAITFRTIGGVFDFYFFMGPSPAAVIEQYTEIIGRPFMPPYWSLGFHLSRFGYQDVEHLNQVWERTRQAGIPFDTQWNDIDYMEANNDFTIDSKRYSDLPSFVKKVHDAGMHYIPILDPGVSGCEAKNSYPPYDEGIEMDIFVKAHDGKTFVGKVWNPNCTVFPDFTNPKTAVYWSKLIKRFHDKVPFDGLWIDMNEPSNFWDGAADGCPNSTYEYPPYVPAVGGGKLFYKTICMTAVQYAGLHYDVHNLYGVSEAAVTNRALKEVLQKRPFIISRSTFPGIGKYSGHWSGDVASTWYDMKRTISEMLTFSMYGVPMMGSDICGFNGNTSEVLCQRWSQLGAFYPFSRNHNTDDAIDQDPVALGADVVNSTIKALTVRYTLLPYLYTLFWKAHVFGHTVARPLFFEFPLDNRTHSLDESFLWGCCLLIVPVLNGNDTIVRTYLPHGVWYDWYTDLGTGSNGTETVLHSSSDTIPVLIRGGSILPTQVPNVTTTLSRLNDFVLIAAPNTSQSASGSLYWDDGEDLLTESYKAYGIVEFELTPQMLSSHVKFWNTSAPARLGTIKILGFPKPIKKVNFNGKEVKFHWNPTTLALLVENLNSLLSKEFILTWS